MQNSINVSKFTGEDLEKLRKEIQKQTEKKRTGNIENVVFNKNTLPKLDAINGMRSNVSNNTRIQ